MIWLLTWPDPLCVQEQSEIPSANTEDDDDGDDDDDDDDDDDEENEEGGFGIQNGAEGSTANRETLAV